MSSQKFTVQKLPENWTLVSANVCLSARVNEVTAVMQLDDHSGRHFLGEIKTKYTYIADSNMPWTVKLMVRGTLVTFKFDTGQCCLRHPGDITTSLLLCSRLDLG